MAMAGNPSRAAVSISSSGWLAPSRKEKLVLHQSGAYMGGLPQSTAPWTQEVSGEPVDKEPENARRRILEVVATEKGGVLSLGAPP